MSGTLQFSVFHNMEEAVGGNEKERVFFGQPFEGRHLRHFGRKT
jgi:hypothetical protein